MTLCNCSDRLGADNVDPLSIAGANVPGFPVGEDIDTRTSTMSETHTFGAATVNSARAAFFCNGFETDKPLNRTSPAELGFGYNSTLPAAQGPPFLIVVRGPGLSNVDLSALKSFTLTERARLQFRAECFDAANHANFAILDNDIASPNFGRALQAPRRDFSKWA